MLVQNSGHSKLYASGEPPAHVDQATFIVSSKKTDSSKQDWLMLKRQTKSVVPAVPLCAWSLTYVACGDMSLVTNLGQVTMCSS